MGPLAGSSGDAQYHACVTTQPTTRTGALRTQARDVVRRALERSIASGRLADSAEARAVEVEVTRPASPEHGDLATNLALRLARPLRMAPPAIAAILAEAIATDG